MTASCPKEKVDRLCNDAKVALENQFLTVHESEKLLGLMESMRPVTQLAAFHYRHIQRQMLDAKKFERIPSQVIYLSQESISDLVWWVSQQIW